MESTKLELMIDPDAYVKQVIAQGGGIITLGGHLAVMVGPPEVAARCPAGWCFVDVTTATVEIVRQAMRETPLNMAAFRGDIEKRKH